MVVVAHSYEEESLLRQGNDNAVAEACETHFFGSETHGLARDTVSHLPNHPPTIHILISSLRLSNAPARSNLSDAELKAQSREGRRMKQGAGEKVLKYSGLVEKYLLAMPHRTEGP